MEFQDLIYRPLSKTFYLYLLYVIVKIRDDRFPDETILDIKWFKCVKLNRKAYNGTLSRFIENLSTNDCHHFHDILRVSFDEINAPFHPSYDKFDPYDNTDEIFDINREKINKIVEKKINRLPIMIELDGQQMSDYITYFVDFVNKIHACHDKNCVIELIKSSNIVIPKSIGIIEEYKKYFLTDGCLKVFNFKSRYKKRGVTYRFAPFNKYIYIIVDILIDLHGSTYDQIVSLPLTCIKKCKRPYSVCEYIGKLEQLLGINYNIFYVDPVSGVDFDKFNTVKFGVLFNEYEPSHEAKDRMNDILPIMQTIKQRKRRTFARKYDSKNFNGGRTHRLNIRKKSFRRQTPF
jgi:hypothetical protein